MNEIVVISGKIAENLPAQPKTGFEVIHTDDFEEVVNHLVSEHRLYPILVIFFIHIDDYPSLYEMLTVLPTPDIIHKYIILAMEARCSQPL